MNIEKYRDYFKSLSDEALSSSIDILFSARSDEESVNLCQVEQIAREEMNKRIETRVNKEAVNG